MKTIQKIVQTLLPAVLAFSTLTPANASDITTKVMNQDVVRGTVSSPDATLKTGVTLNENGAYFLAQRSFNLDQQKYTKDLFCAGYSGKVGNISYYVEGSLVHLPHKDGIAEVVVSATYNTLLQPTITVVHSEGLVKGQYGEFKVGHTFKVSDGVNFTLSGNVGVDAHYATDTVGVGHVGIKGTVSTKLAQDLEAKVSIEKSEGIEYEQNPLQVALCVTYTF